MNIKAYIYLSIASLIIFLIVAFAADDRLAIELKWQTDGRHRDTKAVSKVVYHFNKKFADVYASGGARISLKDFPGSKATRHEMFRDLGNLKVSGRLVLYDMADIDVTAVEFNGSRKAVVETYEEWNFLLQDARTRKPLDRPRGLDGKFRYDLLRTDKGWIVTGYMPIREEVSDENHH